MKQTIAAILTTALLALAPLSGQSVPKERADNQKERIQAGIKDGSITKAEAAKLKQEQREIRQNAKAAKADGNVTGKEKARIARQQNKASRDIYKQKQNQKSK